MKLCTNCRVSRSQLADFGPTFSECIAPQNPRTQDPVTGKITIAYNFCSIARKHWPVGAMCGPDAVWFEPRVSHWSRIIAAFKKIYAHNSR